MDPCTGPFHLELSFPSQPPPRPLQYLPMVPVQGSTSTMWQLLIFPHVYLMADLLLFHI